MGYGSECGIITMSKITALQIQELVRLYVDEGWRIMHLARKYGVAHTSVLYHTRNHQRIRPPITYCPDDVAVPSAHVQRLRQNRPKEFKLYEDYLADEEKRVEKKRRECAHEKVAIICLCCGQHFEETKNQKAKARVVFI